MRRVSMYSDSPSSAAANELGRPKGRGGHKGTMFSTCEKLERQRGAGYAFSPSSFIHGLPSPLLPVSAGSLQLTQDERDQFVDRLILRISENEIGAIAFPQSERCERSTTFSAKTDATAQADTGETGGCGMKCRTLAGDSKVCSIPAYWNAGRHRNSTSMSPCVAVRSRMIQCGIASPPTGIQSHNSRMEFCEMNRVVSTFVSGR